MLVRVFANLRQICGGVGVEVIPEGQRVIDVLDKMVEMFPDLKDELFTAEKKLLPFVPVDKRCDDRTVQDSCAH